jgi:predicted dehydrogenase
MLPGVGIFGAGKVVFHLVPMLRQAGFAVKGIWCQTSEEAAAAARALSIPFSTARIDEIVLLKEVDVIFVMSPPQYQSQITIKALGIGKHVVCNAPGGLQQVSYDLLSHNGMIFSLTGPVDSI